MACTFASSKTYLIIAAYAALGAYQPAKAQNGLGVPTLEIPKAGAVKDIPAAVPSGPADVDIYSTLFAEKALSTQFREPRSRTRGAKDVSLFRQTAPSVVLITANDGLGSGYLAKDNVIVTNLHVVGNNRDVTVVFKPSDPSGKPSRDEVVHADVIKIDQQRDLALLRPRSLPRRPVRPLEISPQDFIDVGSDVHAIGHPTGEAWTYTTGIVSQVRPDYEWSGGPGDIKHHAMVIQTQTPINPGNSGGPLLADDGTVVGVNSFRTQGAEGLNFAVAAKEIRFFLANPSSGMEAQNECKQAKTIFEGRDEKNAAFIRTISLRCDDKADITIVLPDKPSESMYALVDLERRGKPNGIILDPRRLGKWATSLWDIKFDGTFPLRGLHPDGQLMPTRFEPRCGQGKAPLKDFKCS